MQINIAKFLVSTDLNVRKTQLGDGNENMLSQSNNVEENNFIDDIKNPTSTKTDQGTVGFDIVQHSDNLEADVLDESHHNSIDIVDMESDQNENVPSSKVSDHKSELNDLASLDDVIQEKRQC